MIIDYEAGDIGSVSIDHPETDEAINPGDHSDHITTGLAVQSIPKYAQYRRYLHRGYHLRNDPAELSGDALFWKIGQFVAYDKTLYDLTK